MDRREYIDIDLDLHACMLLKFKALRAAGRPGPTGKESDCVLGKDAGRLPTRN